MKKVYWAEHRLPGEPLPAGYFLAPHAALVLGPFAAAGWPAARAAWVLLQPVLAGVCVVGVRRLTPPDRLSSATAAALFAFLLLNPLTLRLVSLGQTGLLVSALLAAGLAAYAARRPVVGAFFLTAAAIKPQLAIPFYVIAIALGGARSLAALVVIGVAATLTAAALAGPRDTLPQYLHQLQVGHKQVGFNRVENDQILSWNRVLYAFGGPAINLSAPVILLGYAAWAAAVRVRAGAMGLPGGLEVALAAAAVAPLAFAGVAGYELVLLVFWVPYVLLLRERGSRAAVFIALCVLTAVIPRGAVAAAIDPLGLSGAALAVCLSYRSFVVLALCACLLIVGRPPVGRPTLHTLGTAVP